MWRVECGERCYALRRTPAGEGDAERVVWLNETLRAAARGGAAFVAAPVSAADGADFVRAPDGSWWTAAAWRSGEPLSPESSPDQQRAAVEALATFHESLADAASIGLSRAVEDRAARLGEPPPRGGGELGQLAASLRQRAAHAVRRFADVPLVTQPVQIDSRPEHFLLTGDEVTGLVDFAATRVDAPAVDVARLAGELAAPTGGAYAERIAQVVRWYNDTAKNSVSADLVTALDLSGAVFAADNWREWLAEGRLSRTDPAVSRRVEGLTARLRALEADA